MHCQHRAPKGDDVAYSTKEGGDTMTSKVARKAKGGYIFCKKVVRKDGTVIRPKKAEALRIPISTLKNRKS